MALSPIVKFQLIISSYLLKVYGYGEILCQHFSKQPCYKTPFILNWTRSSDVLL